MWIPTRIPIGGSACARKASAPSGLHRRGGAGRAAPEAVGRERPDADDGEKQHDLFEHGVEGAIGDQDSGDRVAETGRGETSRASGASVGAGSGKRGRRPRAPR